MSDERFKIEHPDDIKCSAYCPDYFMMNDALGKIGEDISRKPVIHTVLSNRVLLVFRF